MQTEFILQNPSNPNTAWILPQLRAILEDADIEDVQVYMAYVSRDGVEALAPQLEALGRKVTFFAGCGEGNDVTSKQAITRLVETGINVNLFNTKRTDSTFHPKVIVCRGKDTIKVYSGSANLTRAALSKNIEQATFLSFSRHDAEACQQVEAFTALGQSLIDTCGNHVIDVSSTQDAQDLQETFHWLIDEDCPKRETQRMLQNALKPAIWDNSKLPLTSNPHMPAKIRKAKPKALPDYIRSVTTATTLEHGEQKSQSDIYEVLMKLLLIAPGGQFSSTQFKIEALRYFEPYLTEKDKEKLDGTKDMRIKKTFENVISHRTSKNNPIAEGYVGYDPETRMLSLTTLGRFAMTQ